MPTRISHWALPALWRLSSVAGVGRVSVEGGVKPAIRIQADLARLSSYGISMADLRGAIQSIDRRLFTLPADTLVLAGQADPGSLGPIGFTGEIVADDALRDGQARRFDRREPGAQRRLTLLVEALLGIGDVGRGEVGQVVAHGASVFARRCRSGSSSGSTRSVVARVALSWLRSAVATCSSAAA